MSEAIVASTSDTDTTQEKRDESSTEDESPSKKLKLNINNSDDPDNKLEARLGGILCCAVCLDLPSNAVYQCANGHLMCAGCFTHLLADARIRDESATCPNCRVEISRSIATRNLAVEKAVSELPASCEFCSKKFPRNSLEYHEQEQCEERLVRCEYHLLGCNWRGPHHEVKHHEQQCQQPSHTGAQILPYLRRDVEARDDYKSIFNKILYSLSLEKITFIDIQLKPYRTDEFIHKLFYETSRFSALNLQWVVKAHLNDNQKDTHLSCKRYLTYQLLWKSKAPSPPVNMQFMVIKGPYGDVRVKPHLHSFEFSEGNIESPFLPLPLPDSAECNKVLAARVIEVRLMMAMMTK